MVHGNNCDELTLPVKYFRHVHGFPKLCHIRRLVFAFYVAFQNLLRFSQLRNCVNAISFGCHICYVTCLQF